jgi:hypothetical protein
MITSTVQPRAVLDQRLGAGGGSRYGFVWFDEPGATDPHTMGGPEGGAGVVRVGYTTGLGEGTAELRQANWGIAWPWHFQAAANVLIEAGILVPHDGKIRLQVRGWDAPQLVRADAIDRDVVFKPKRSGNVGGGFVHLGR